MDGSETILLSPDAPEIPEVGPLCIELLDLTVEAPLVSPDSMDGEDKTPVTKPGPIVHRLMENVHPPKELDRVYDRDYLSRRFRAMGGDGDGKDPWKGATELEKNLISCVDEGGAIRRDHILKFLSCFGDELSDEWALPLAILERSQKEDEEDASMLAAAVEQKVSSKKSTEKAKVGKRKRTGDEDDSDYSSGGAEEEEEDDEEEWGKSDEEEELDSSSSSRGSPDEFSTTSSRKKQSLKLKAVTEMSPEVVKVQKPKPKTSRMELFVQHGGLKLLSRWLRFTTNSERQSGSLILPLLSLISKVPFNFEAIQLSRINKTILNIKRAMKKTLKEDPETKTAYGNNSFQEVFEAVDGIIRVWKEKQKSQKPKTTTQQQNQHPLGVFRNKINEVADDFIASRKPEPAEETSTDTTNERRSVKELARIEREKEKGNNLTRDLEEIRKKRKEANRKLLEAQARREPPMPEPRIGTNRVRWKDGLRTVEKPDKQYRELLETVRVFNKHQTAAGNDVLPDPVSVDVTPVERDLAPTSEYNERKPPPSYDHAAHSYDHPMVGRWVPPVHQERASFQERATPPNHRESYAERNILPPRKTVVTNASSSTDSISSSFTMLDKPPPNFRNQGQSQSYSNGKREEISSSFALLDKPLSREGTYAQSSNAPPAGTGGDQSKFVMDARSLVKNAGAINGKGKKKRRKRWNRRY